MSLSDEGPWKTTTTQPRQDTNDPGPLGMKVVVIPPEEEPQPTEVLAEGNGNAK